MRNEQLVTVAKKKILFISNFQLLTPHSSFLIFFLRLCELYLNLMARG
jgi:hypothetical protein